MMPGKLAGWDRTGDLASITVPTLVVGATHDTMDPAHLAWMAGAVAHGRYHHCPDGSHLAIYDDQAAWFEGVLGFLRDVDSGRF
jgi:proline iminopeptidase